MFIINTKLKAITKVVDIVTVIISKLDENTDGLWAGYAEASDIAELKSELSNIIEELRNNKLTGLSQLKNYFVPTSVFQELSLSNGWSSAYLKLAEEFDAAIRQIEYLHHFK